MENELVQILVNSSGAVAVCGMFLGYLTKQNKLEEKKHDQFIKAITLNTVTVNGVEKKVERVVKKVDIIADDNREYKRVIEEMYKHALEAYRSRQAEVL